MNIEALAVIGTATLVVAAILYIPVYIWIKRKRKREVLEGKIHDRVTKTGWVMFTLLILTLLIGFAQEYLSPESSLGHFVSTPHGRKYFALGLLVVWLPVVFVIEKCGYKLIEKGRIDA